ncbi:MAG: response regulator transcription factor, partial [Clostridia bacterium]|nr:response regulator transcription factor [Clostridia bacterium]
ARIRSVTRRYGRETGDSVIGIDGLTVSVNEARVFRDGEEVFLTAMEYRLLLIMLQNRGVVLTRSRLLEYIWDVEGDFVNDNTLTVYIKRLRDKIERDPAEPAIIKTKRGMGYYIEK